MKKITNFLLCILLLSASVVSAQYGIGTDSPNSSAALDISSTTGGVLVPRMNSTQRDLVASPANALLIFNTTNNSFEVYKSTCSCWVTVYDGGNTPASSLVNTAPTANNVSVSGQYLVGKTLTLNYTYFDGQQDLEGLTTIQWQISGNSNGTNPDNIAGASSTTYVPVIANIGNYIRAVVTPRASSGVLNGVGVASNWILIETATTPTANNLVVIGTPAQSSVLTASYTFAGGSGTENLTLSGTQYLWQTASDALGNNIYNAPLYFQTTHTNTFTPKSDLIGKYMRLAVKVKDNNGLQSSNYVVSPWVGPITAALEAAPVASNVTFSPANPGTNVVLTASYVYSDVNEDPKGTPMYQWYTADDASGTNQTAIAGATSSTFTVTNSQASKFIGLGVTPVAITGTPTGTQVVYYDPTASTASATFSFTGVKQLSNNFYVNHLMGATDKISVSINVTSPGSIAFSTPTVNGYSFNAGNTFAVGTYEVVLTATGTQTAYNASGDSFTITGVGSTIETTSLTVTNVKVGADFTAHKNGITAGISSNNLLPTYTDGETFNNNGNCVTKPISASACVGSTITIGSNTYPIANINGQCWMTQNLKELPNGVAVNAAQWLNTSVTDQGYYGYYNTSTTNGSAGWATTVPAAGEGLLYQWSAAMLGSTSERAQGICPTGWHVPSDCEWMYLEHGLGMELSEQVLNNVWRSNNNNQGTPGNKLRSEGTGQSNASGFSGLLTGQRYLDSNYYDRNSLAIFWTSSYISSDSVRNRLLGSNYKGVARLTTNKQNAYSVRCLKD